MVPISTIVCCFIAHSICGDACNRAGGNQGWGPFWPAQFRVLIVVVPATHAPHTEERLQCAADLFPFCCCWRPLQRFCHISFFPGEIVKTPAGAFSLASWYQIALLSIALMFPVAFLSGIVFPSIAASVQATVEDRMNSTGVTTLFNTTGAAIGPLFASFVLLPCFGYQWSLVFCAVIYALLSVLVSERSSWSIRRPTGLIITALCAAVILLLAIFPYHRAESHFAHASRPYEIDEHGKVLAHVVKRIEGTSDTYQLLRRDFLGEPYYYRLLTNAFSMSATNPRNQRYMRLFAYLPLALRPEAKDALLICYGCGVTADALLHGPNIKRLDIVDISKEVFRLADFYSGINYSNPLRDPRVRAIVQDGRFFLQAAPQQVPILSRANRLRRKSLVPSIFTLKSFFH